MYVHIWYVYIYSPASSSTRAGFLHGIHPWRAILHAIACTPCSCLYTESSSLQHVHTCHALQATCNCHACTREPYTYLYSHPHPPFITCTMHYICIIMHVKRSHPSLSLKPLITCCHFACHLSLSPAFQQLLLSLSSAVTWPFNICHSSPSSAVTWLFNICHSSPSSAVTWLFNICHSAYHQLSLGFSTSFTQVHHQLSLGLSTSVTQFIIGCHLAYHQLSLGFSTSVTQVNHRLSLSLSSAVTWLFNICHSVHCRLSLSQSSAVTWLFNICHSAYHQLSLGFSTSVTQPIISCHFVLHQRLSCRLLSH